jgi:hypothetical protein
MVIVQHDIETLTLLGLLGHTPTHLPKKYLYYPQGTSLLFNAEGALSVKVSETDKTTLSIRHFDVPTKVPAFCRKPLLRAP